MRNVCISTFDHIRCICHAIPRDCKYLEDRYCGVYPGAHALCVCVCVSLYMHSYILYMYSYIYLIAPGIVLNAKYLFN